MTFDPSSVLQVDKRLSEINVMEETGPATVIFKNQLFLFYHPAGITDIFYSSSNDGSTWSQIDGVKAHRNEVNIAMSTSPCPVFFKDHLYLFYNGWGKDGTYMTVFDGDNWDPILRVADAMKVSMGFQPSTSPSATVFQGKIYLFWNGIEKNGLFATTFDGSSWTGPINLPGALVADGTSPAAVTYNNCLYVFFNGKGKNGTWYTKLTADGTWQTPPTSVKDSLNGMGFLAETSPSAFCFPPNGSQSQTLCLLWDGSGSDGNYYALLNGDTWEGGSQISLAATIHQEVIATTGCGVAFQQVPFLFWRASTGLLWWATGLKFNDTKPNWSGVAQCLSANQRFTLTISDQTAVAFVVTLHQKAVEQQGSILANQFSSFILPSSSQSNNATLGLISVFSFIATTSSFTCFMPAGVIDTSQPVVMYFTSARLPGNENRMIMLA